MELQISHCIRAEIQKASFLRRKKEGNRYNSKVSAFVGYLKGKSATMIHEQFGELKYKYRNREFWCKGYYVDTVGKNTARIAEYIKHQLEEDKLGEQLSMPEANPFKSKKRK